MEIKGWSTWKKALVITGIVLFFLLLTLFLLIWVAFPLVWMSSGTVEKFFLFYNINSPKNPDFDHPETYNVTGAVNVYITVIDLDNSTLLSIGAWVIPQETEMGAIAANSTALDILETTSKPILLYLHGIGCNRAKNVRQYEVLRKYFLVIALDYRGYGDSGSNVELFEAGVVNDITQVFRWTSHYTSNDIFIWGYSLGTGIGIHAVRMLKQFYNEVPAGVVLEAPFSTMREEVYTHRFAAYFRWLKYFNTTFLDPLPQNGIKFESTAHILHVDCPVMMIHAEDDDVVPYQLAEKLYKVASSQRTPSQGNVTFYLLPAVGYKHVDILEAPQIHQYIEDFITECLSRSD